MASSSVRNAAAGRSPSPVGTGNAHSRRPRRVRDRNGLNGWILHRSRRLQDLEKHGEAAVFACPVQTSAGVNRGGSCSVENIGACTRQMRDLNVEETCCNCPKAAWVWVVRSARRHVALNSVRATTMSTPPTNGSHGPARNARSPGHVHSYFQISELLLISQEHVQTTASQHAPASFQGQLAGDSGPAAVTYILTRRSPLLAGLSKPEIIHPPNVSSASLSVSDFQPCQMPVSFTISGASSLGHSAYSVFCVSLGYVLNFPRESFAP